MGQAAGVAVFELRAQVLVLGLRSSWSLLYLQGCQDVFAQTACSAYLVKLLDSEFTSLQCKGRDPFWYRATRHCIRSRTPE